MSLHALRGMNDILPEAIPLWHQAEQRAREFFSLYGYEEIRTPILEELSLFSRTIGEATPLVEKEMYSFQDKGEKWVALRPEGTASVVRAYLESGRAAQEPIARFYYLGPMYRRERPQKGRLRQFHQIGVEALGVASPFLDAEMIHMLDLYLKGLGVTDLEIELNSLGCPLCRPKFQTAFQKFLLENQKGLCEECQKRMGKNPLRILDCKEEGCRKITEESPSIQDFLCAECERDLDLVLESLGALGSSFKINPRIVRGLDYYTKTTFEVTSTKLGAQNAVAGGGRYDGLVRLLGGPNVPGVGFAIGMERLIDLMQERPSTNELKGGNQLVFVAPVGDLLLREAMKVAEGLRREGIATEVGFDGKSLKSQMRRADKLGARHVIILGEEELKKKIVILRDMIKKSQEEIPAPEILRRLKSC